MLDKIRCPVFLIFPKHYYSDTDTSNRGSVTRKWVFFHVSVLQSIAGYYQLFPKSPLVCFWMSYMPIIILRTAEAVEAFISGTKNMEKSSEYNMVHPWLGTGLLTSHGSKWKSRRKLLTPSFHFEILKDFLPVFNEQSQILVKHLQSEITKDFTDIATPITLCSLDIICETTLGVSIGAQKNSESQYVKSVSRASDLIFVQIALNWHNINYLMKLTEGGRELSYHLKILHEFTRSIIQKKRKRNF
ncbi:cytochrome P450 4V2 [Caerostris extrusa]|uniref:Cytochrome P450 4V2 n=1 Tax=Caerostris extrusa TaxID=172846 RepID=A0AAV4Y631_CAEEX|nr:cytochrome P450 4V2 [Caerostris extrusa]